MESSARSADCPCKLFTTSALNGHLPVISRVCFEAREVALEAAKPVTQPEVAAPDDCVLTAFTAYRKDAWQGRERAAVLLNWDPRYVYEFGGADENGGLTEPLKCLEWELSRSDSEQVGAFPAGYLDYDYGSIIPDVSVPYKKPEHRSRTYEFQKQDKAEWIRILSRRPKWHVVMRTVVVHAHRSVHRTGLFGILGDAPIQIVDIRDQEKINAMYDLAEACERSSVEQVRNRQKFYRSSVQEMELFLQGSLTHTFGAAEWPFELRPTIMFRWCPLMCNHTAGPLERKRRNWPIREDRI